MGDIYDAASDIDAWLGTASANSDEAMNFIRNLPKEWMTSAIATSLNALLDQPYQSRLWIVQEVILGGSHGAQMFYGFEAVTSAHLYSFLSQVDTTSAGSFITSSTPFELIAENQQIANEEIRPHHDRFATEWLELCEFFRHEYSNSWTRSMDCKVF